MAVLPYNDLRLHLALLRFSYPCKGMKKTIPAEIHSFNGYYIIRKKFFLKI